MIRVIHAADFHLDSPFQGLSAEQAAQRRREQRELLDRLAELAISSRAQVVLLAGDLFDSGEIYRETAQALADALGRIPCPVFIAPGNHDCYTDHSPYRTIPWPEQVHLFTSERPEAVVLPELGCTVYGAAFTAPARENEPLAGFHAPEDGALHLMVLHGDVGGRGRYAPITVEQIAASGLDYLALGHVHTCSGMQRAGQTGWAYPGCPEGRGFDELGEKGVLCGTVERGRAALDFVPLCKRRYRLLTADVTDTTPLRAAEAALTPEYAPDICRLVFTGESYGAIDNLSALTAQLTGRCYALSLRDQTSLRRDLWDRAGEDTLTGLFLRQMRARMDGAACDEERAKVTLAVRFGLAALENGEDVRP